jgi:hypothetical protein
MKHIFIKWDSIIKHFIIMHDYIKTYEGRKINVFDKDEITFVNTQ